MDCIIKDNKNLKEVKVKMSYNEIICEVNNELEIYYETYDRY